MRSTLTDIAREAGVSPATVDRVLNNRPGVRARTREIVIEMAQRLGYIAEASSGAQPRSAPGQTVRLDFALPAGTNSFIKLLHRHIKVVTIASDILHVPRVAYIGIDNRAAGRLAGYLLNRFMGSGRPGKVALFAGSLAYRGHEEREMGFRHILAEESPNLEIVEMREMLDDREKAYSEACALLERHPDLAAIYNVGAGNTGIARALKERGRAKDIIFLGHEVTDGTKELLLDGTLDAVIDQNPRVEAREALNILSHSVRGLPYELHQPRLQVIFRESIPEI